MTTAITTHVPEASWRDLVRWAMRRRQRFVVAGSSMQPTIEPGDVVLVDTTAYRAAIPANDDVVVLRHPRNDELAIVKRVHYVDDFGRTYLLSDNNSEIDAEDSRRFGLVEPHNLVGRVTSRLTR
ncbi:MAG: nickel-type superoxide dismutase maturation protease [Acidimicrobiales bacterium]